MQIRTTISYYFTPVRLTHIKKNRMIIVDMELEKRNPFLLMGIATVVQSFGKAR